jgi:very-short-patch-repair endonuclease
MDLGSVVDPSVLERAIETALVTRLTSVARLEWRLTRQGTRGHPGAASLRRVLEDYKRRSAVPESMLEARFVRLLRRARLPLPVEQLNIRTPSGQTFRADFAYPHARLIIEVQGYRWHGGHAEWRRDLDRNSTLAAQGWRVLYVTWHDIVRDPKRTITRIREALFPELWHADPL